MPTLGLIVQNDARTQTSLTGGIKGGKGEKATGFYKNLDGEPNALVPRSGAGPWDRTGAVKDLAPSGQLQPPQESRESNGRTESGQSIRVPAAAPLRRAFHSGGNQKGLEDLKADKDSKGGVSTPQSGFGGFGGGGGFGPGGGGSAGRGGGGRGPEKKWDDHSALTDGIYFGNSYGFDNGSINNNVTGGRSVTSSTTTNGSPSSNWSLPSGGSAIPNSDSTGRRDR